MKDYDRPTNQIRTSRTEDCEMHEQGVYASREFDAQRKGLNSFVTVGGEDDEREEIWVAKVLLSCRCSVKRDTEGTELTFVQYMKCITPLDKAGERLGCVCLRRATTDDEENECGVGTALKENDCTVTGE